MRWDLNCLNKNTLSAKNKNFCDQTAWFMEKFTSIKLFCKSLYSE